MAAIVRAELAWLRTVTADLRAGRLTWDASHGKIAAAGAVSPSPELSPSPQSRERVE
jgi:hypothetical protein